MYSLRYFKACLAPMIFAQAVTALLGSLRTDLDAYLWKSNSENHDLWTPRAPFPPSTNWLKCFLTTTEAEGSLRPSGLLYSTGLQFQQTRKPFHGCRGRTFIPFGCHLSLPLLHQPSSLHQCQERRWSISCAFLTVVPINTCNPSSDSDREGFTYTGCAAGCAGTKCPATHNQPHKVRVRQQHLTGQRGAWGLRKSF